MTIFAYIAAVWLIAGGAAMFWQRSRRFGTVAMTVLYGIFVLFPLPPLLHSAALPRISSGCLHRCRGQGLRTGNPFCRSSDRLDVADQAGLCVAEDGSSRSGDLWILLDLFRPWEPDGHLGGGSLSPAAPKELPLYRSISRVCLHAPRDTRRKAMSFEIWKPSLSNSP
jgi:hypothetical protein